MKSLAKTISFIFLPLFVPIYALIAVFYVPALPKSFYLLDALYHYPQEAKLLYLLLFGVFIVVAPGFSLIVLKLNKSISSLSLDQREERFMPISIMIFYTAILYVFLLYQQESTYVPRILKAMVLGGFISSVIAYFWNKWEKISLHGVGMGAFVGFLFMYFALLEKYNLIVLLVAIFLAGITLSARLFLNKHSSFEVLLGFSVGFCTQALVVFFHP
ncbi:MAG: hypothetical protein JJT77_08295 [Crocinitomicaceae bacterium]|jgi:hypothetical protein|nr:hypothetical protein [Crocinitomicaceae bacterium]